MRKDHLRTSGTSMGLIIVNQMLWHGTSAHKHSLTHTRADPWNSKQSAHNNFAQNLHRRNSTPYTSPPHPPGWAKAPETCREVTAGGEAPCPPRVNPPNAQNETQGSMITKPLLQVRGMALLDTV